MSSLDSIMHINSSHVRCGDTLAAGAPSHAPPFAPFFQIVGFQSDFRVAVGRRRGDAPGAGAPRRQGDKYQEHILECPRQDRKKSKYTIEQFLLLESRNRLL